MEPWNRCCWSSEIEFRATDGGGVSTTPEPGRPEKWCEVRGIAHDERRDDFGLSGTAGDAEELVFASFATLWLSYK